MLVKNVLYGESITIGGNVKITVDRMPDGRKGQVQLVIDAPRDVRIDWPGKGKRKAPLGGYV